MQKNCLYQHTIPAHNTSVISNLNLKMATRTVLNLIGSPNWRPVASEILHILNMNRVQDAVVCHTVPELLRMCRNYEQQVIIWPTLPEPRIIGQSIGCVSNTLFINRFTPYQTWTVYIPEPKQIIDGRVLNRIRAHTVWPLHSSEAEKTAWLDKLVGFSNL